MRPLKLKKIPISRLRQAAALVEKRGACEACGSLKILGNCEFGIAHPDIIHAPHCLGCCKATDRDKWRPYFVQSAAKR